MLLHEQNQNGQNGQHYQQLHTDSIQFQTKYQQHFSLS